MAEMHDAETVVELNHPIAEETPDLLREKASVPAAEIERIIHEMEGETDEALADKNELV